MVESLVAFDPAITIKYGVHTTLYGDTIKVLGTDKHRKYLENCYNYEDIGCFCLTELGHGTNAKEIMTTAVYDKET